MGRVSMFSACSRDESDWEHVLDGDTGLGSGRVREHHIQGSILRDVSLGSSRGANVIICSEDGYKSSFHEHMLRSYTTIFEIFKAEEDRGESSRDVFGDYIFILEGADWEAVNGLADLLYTGKCDVSTRASETLKGLLTPEVCAKVSSSVSSSTRGPVSSVAPPATTSYNDLRVKQERMELEDDTFEHGPMSQQLEEPKIRVRNLKRSKERDPIEGGKKAKKASEEGSSGSDLRSGPATQDEQVEDNAAKQKLINSPELEKDRESVGDDISNNIGDQGDESAELEKVEGTETAKKTSDTSKVKGSGSGLRSGSSTFTEARDKQLKDDAAKREAKRKLQHQQEIEKARQAVGASPAPLAVEYGAAEPPNEDANIEEEPTPGPSGLSTVTAEPPLGQRAPTGNIIRLNAADSASENDQRAPTGNIIRLNAADSASENDQRIPSNGEGISNVRKDTQGPSGEKSGNMKKSDKVQKAGSGKSSTSETHATVGQPRKIKQISQYPGTVKVKRDASNNVERVVELAKRTETALNVASTAYQSKAGPSTSEDGSNHQLAQVSQPVLPPTQADTQDLEHPTFPDASRGAQEMHATPAQGASASATLPTEAYHEHIVDALSRLREDNVDQIAIELMDEDEGLALHSENQLSVFVEIIHEMALSDKGSLEKYARLCKCFQGKEVKASFDDGKTISFQKVMRTRCLELFNQNVYRTDGVSADKIEEIIRNGSVEDWHFNTNRLEREVLKRFYGNIRLIGELYNLDLLSTRTIHLCLVDLTKRPDNVSLECTATLLKSVGRRLEEATQDHLATSIPNVYPVEAYFQRLSSTVGRLDSDVCDRVTVIIIDLMTWRGHGMPEEGWRVGTEDQTN